MGSGEWSFASPYAESSASLWLLGCRMIPFCARSRTEDDDEGLPPLEPLPARGDSLLAPASQPAAEPASQPLDKQATEALLFCSSDSVNETEMEVLAMFREQRAVVKTVKNDNWFELEGILQSGIRKRSSCTLPPRDGKGMDLFGRLRYGVCGVVWDLDVLDTSDAVFWPSGFQAKTEFNVSKDGTLSRDIFEAQVKLEDLRRANDEYTATPNPESAMMMYNESYVALEAERGIKGVFTRSPGPLGVLFALGIRALMCRTLGLKDADLAVLCLTPEDGVRVITEGCLTRVIEHFTLSPRAVMASIDEQPYHIRVSGYAKRRIDLRALGALSPRDKMVMHGVYGLIQPSLEEALSACCGHELEMSPMLESSQNETAQDKVMKSRCWQYRALHDRRYDGAALVEGVLVGLDTAIKVDNSFSAHQLIKEAVLFMIWREDEDPTPEMLFKLAPELMKRHIQSDAMLHAIGAYSVLCGFASGELGERLVKTTGWLKDWLAQSSSLTFRMQSYKELCERTKQSGAQESTSVMSFVGSHAASNRKAFYERLQELTKCMQAETAYLATLYDIVESVSDGAVLRMDMLRGILGLDTRWTHDALVRTVRIAWDCARCHDIQDDLSPMMTPKEHPEEALGHPPVLVI